jgi:hypothetical protein
MKAHDMELYKELYKKYLEVPWKEPLKQDDVELFRKIDERRTVDELIHFRKVANEEIVKEAEMYEKWITEEKKKKVQVTAVAQKTKNWFGWGYEAENAAIPAPGIIQLTTDVKKELLSNVLGEQANSLKLPPPDVSISNRC